MKTAETTPAATPDQITLTSAHVRMLAEELEVSISDSREWVSMVLSVFLETQKRSALPDQWSRKIARCREILEANKTWKPVRLDQRR